MAPPMDLAACGSLRARRGSDGLTELRAAPPSSASRGVLHREAGDGSPISEWGVASTTRTRTSVARRGPDSAAAARFTTRWYGSRPGGLSAAPARALHEHLGLAADAAPVRRERELALQILELLEPRLRHLGRAPRPRSPPRGVLGRGEYLNV